MPGMMDTVLNLGLNDKTVLDLAEASNDIRFAFDSYRRFIQMYSDIVLNVPHSDFEEILEEEKLANNLILDTELTPKNMKKRLAMLIKIGPNLFSKLSPKNLTKAWEKAAIAREKPEIKGEAECISLINITDQSILAPSTSIADMVNRTITKIGPVGSENFLIFVTLVCLGEATI